MKHLFILTIVIILAGCAAKKAAIEFDNQPEWVKKKPTLPGYYTGVGSAKKVGLPARYIENAKRDALADLAGEVSVQVKATSVLQTIETNYGLTESYSQRIETSTSGYLEGFEPVASYENEATYWVYYRISQAVYHEAREKKKKESLDAALSKYISGNGELDNHRPKEALTFYLQGLQALQNYMKEENLVAIEGRKMDIGNELFSSLNDVVLSLSVKPESNETAIKRGETNSPALSFTVFFQHVPVQGVPVEFKYSGGYLKQSRKISGDNGKITVDLGKILTKNSTETVEAAIDLKEIALHAVDDIFIRGLLAKRTMEPAVIKLSVFLPIAALKIDDLICSETDCSGILMKFSEIALREGFTTSDKEMPDFIFNILTPQITPGESAGGLTSVYVQADLMVSDSQGNQFLIKKTDPVKGVGKTMDEANQKAFTGMLLNMERIYLKQAIDQLK